MLHGNHLTSLQVTEQTVTVENVIVHNDQTFLSVTSGLYRTCFSSSAAAEKLNTGRRKKESVGKNALKVSS